MWCRHHRELAEIGSVVVELSISPHVTVNEDSRSYKAIDWVYWCAAVLFTICICQQHGQANYLLWPLTPSKPRQPLKHRRGRKAWDLLWLHLHSLLSLALLQSAFPFLLLLFLATALFSTGCLLWFNVPVGLFMSMHYFVLGKYDSNYISGFLGKIQLSSLCVCLMCHPCCLRCCLCHCFLNLCYDARFPVWCCTHCSKGSLPLFRSVLWLYPRLQESAERCATVILFNCFLNTTLHTRIKFCHSHLTITVQMYFIWVIQAKPLVIPLATVLCLLRAVCRRRAWANDIVKFRSAPQWYWSWCTVVLRQHCCPLIYLLRVPLGRVSHLCFSGGSCPIIWGVMETLDICLTLCFVTLFCPQAFKEMLYSAQDQAPSIEGKSVCLSVYLSFCHFVSFSFTLSFCVSAHHCNHTVEE